MEKIRRFGFLESEEKLFEEFLKECCFFDFYTLAYISILKFIKMPEIELTSVVQKINLESKVVRVN